MSDDDRAADGSETNGSEANNRENNGSEADDAATDGSAETDRAVEADHREPGADSTNGDGSPGGVVSDGPDGVDIEAGVPEDVDPFDELDAPAADEAVDDLFTEVEVDEIDEEEIWAAIDADDGGDADALGTAEAGRDDSNPADADEAVISKASYCQKCEYFAEPPEVGCSHDGTEILELVDNDSFRVRNCPVVEQRHGMAEEVLEK